MSKQLSLGKITVSNPKVWVVIGVTVAGIVILAETRRRRLRVRKLEREDFGAFIDRFELLPFPQPPPPAARHILSGLTFAVKDMFVSYDFNLVSNHAFAYVYSYVYVYFKRYKCTNTHKSVNIGVYFTFALEFFKFKKNSSLSSSPMKI